MPKRYLSVEPMNSIMTPHTFRQKTQRSHQQNQERAYVAASRRSDRSIEARVQSARMASQVHKTRTGKALRVSKEIVMMDEMYEEEDDGLLRSYRILGQHLQTPSVDMNSKVDAYLKSQAIMSQMVSSTEKDWRENEVNRQFAQCFHHADQTISKRWATPRFSISSTSSQAQGDHQHALDIQSVNCGQEPYPGAQNQSPSGVSQSQLGSADIGTLSPSALTPESTTSPEIPQANVGSVSGNSIPPDAFMDYDSDGSVFTTELPLEAKLLITGFDQHETFDPIMYDQQCDTRLDSSYEVLECANGENVLDIHDDFLCNRLDSMNWDPIAHQNNSTDEFFWDTFINDSPWNNDQQSASGHSFL
ncbi:hypothetical protein EDB81DRAFT_693124 [Dactylonectria macrodidyma]|uniref:Uncharacterized protein n=1 Tax=Dactylonectria macrodidyma TaxID=307937 RepID=A0A9P9J1D1_9HYPO|nr:hypothetical protein EDB81DRAFT_693124 [Dactylonectria macrodidyma]